MPSISEVVEVLEAADVDAVEAEAAETLTLCKRSVAKIRVKLAQAILLLQQMEQS